MVPELWWPESGRMERTAVYDVAEGTVRVPLHLSPHGSVFVVFRKEAPGTDRIVAVRHDGETILDAKTASSRDPASTPGAAADVHDNFTLAVWAKPAADTTLHEEANAGANALSEPRNDAIFPPHGNAFGAGTHAGSGLAIGRNGLCVLEHGAAYFAPVLVHAVPLKDWTHIAVVYRDAQPSLYLNGVLVHTGLKSTYTVHPGTAAATGAGRSSVDWAQWKWFPARWKPRRSRRSCSPCCVQAFARRAAQWNCREVPRACHVPGVAAGRIHVGACRWTKRTVRVDAIPDPLHITGPWEVQFDPHWGGPQQIVFEALGDWTHARRKASGTTPARRPTARRFPCRQQGQDNDSGSIWVRSAIWPSSVSMASRSAHSGSRRGAWRSPALLARATMCWKWM